MKLLITGGAGFIGSAVVRLAISRGYSVVNVDALTYASSLKNVEVVAEHPNYKFVQENICDGAALLRTLKQYQPDTIMHLAAETHVDRSIDDPEKFIQTNVHGSFNLLEAARAYWQSNHYPETFRFHHISTDEVFGSLPNTPNVYFTEDTAYDPRSPYAASKASSDHLVRAWYETYGLPILITNCSNNYGPHQFPEKFIPILILNALAEKPLPIYGNGENIRDWLYVDDHADALLCVMQKGAVGRSYNIGGENEWTNLGLAKTLCSKLDYILPREKGSYSDLITFVPDRPGHDLRYAMNSSRINDELGWQPSVTLENGLEKTIRWFLNNQDWWLHDSANDNFGQRLGLDTLF